jgi:hypothetical protein
MSVRQTDPKSQSESLGMRTDLVVEHEPWKRFVENESHIHCDI